MAKYEIAAVIVIRVVMVWKRRRGSGTVHARAEKPADARTMITKTTLSDQYQLHIVFPGLVSTHHSVRLPASPATSKCGGSGLHTNQLIPSN
jgi:hypothetical protein